MSRRDEAAGPGTVRIRLLGELPGCSVLASLLAGMAAVEVLSADGPYLNRRETGGRLYLSYLLVRARAAVAGRPVVTFDLDDDGDTYFMLTEALLDFAARERITAGAGVASHARLAAVADALLASVDASLPILPRSLPRPGETSEVLAGRIRQDLGASISFRSPLDA